MTPYVEITILLASSFLFAVSAGVSIGYGTVLVAEALDLAPAETNR